MPYHTDLDSVARRMTYGDVDNKSGADDMKKLFAMLVLSLFATAIAAETAFARCGTNSGKRYYNGKCV
ncbi:hypothetical protein [Bosea sp. AAP35]|uniref:hypothetical protein n=1 Tax=Bosea sp. AAP35 TaxID=1523417 RepID=UPI0012E1D8AC|nr:hypothetical protein [Bosea sp. AAP35]